MADMAASVPDDTKRMRSAYRWLDKINSPSSFSSLVGVPNDVPFAIVAVTFSTTAG